MNNISKNNTVQDYSSDDISSLNSVAEHKLTILTIFELAKPILVKTIFEKIQNKKYYNDHSDFDKMTHFVKNISFDKFYKQFTLAIVDFSDKDLDSIGSSTPSRSILSLMNCFEVLNQNGYSLAKGNQINFWTGENAKKRAWQDLSLSDSKIPAISLGFDLCRAVQEVEKSKNILILARKLPNIVSSIFASLAKEQVHVFISSNKVSEPSSIIVGNNLFRSELPVVQRLVSQNIVKNVWIHIQSNNGDWLQPVDFNSKEADWIPVVRRLPYKIGNPQLDDKDEGAFVVIERWKNPSAFAGWCASSPARSSITLGQLKSFARQLKVLATKATNQFSD